MSATSRLPRSRVGAGLRRALWVGVGATAPLLAGCRSGAPSGAAPAGTAIGAVAAPSRGAPVPDARGAVATGRYRNLFAEWDPALDSAAVQRRLDAYWAALFGTDPERRVYYPDAPTADGPTAYILDVNNADIRSEGMSYGMMIAVQMDRRAEFDALWNWTRTHMRYREGPRAGYFRWQCVPVRRCDRDAVPASDGEEYLATALLMAAGRWGNGEGLRDYAGAANDILDAMLHKEEMNGGVVDGVTSMFDRRHHQVVFVPVGDGATFSDPSYHLPAFYELWARRARGWRGARDADRAFWRAAADTSRAYLARAAHPATGLTPDYATFAGAPVHRDGHGDFRFDAFRVAMNQAVDHAWWAADPAAVARTDRLQAFFERQGLGAHVNQFTIDGRPVTRERSTALVAANGAASLAASHPRAWRFVEALWTLEPPSGRYRYYDGLVAFRAVLHAGGRFRAY